MYTYQSDINFFRWGIYFAFGIPFLAWLFLTRNSALRILAAMSVLVCIQDVFVAHRYLWAISIGPSNITAYVALMACLMRGGLPSGLGITFGAWGAFIASAFFGLLIGSIGTPYLVPNFLNFQQFYVEGFFWFLLGIVAFRRTEEVHQFLVGMIALGIVMAGAHLFCIATGFEFPNLPIEMKDSRFSNGALFTNANSMGNAVAPLIPVAVMFALARREAALVRLLASGGVLVMIASLLLTGARGPFLETAVLLALAFFWSRSGLGRTALVAALGVAILGAGLSGTALLLPDLFSETIETLKAQGLNTPRPAIWMGYLHLIAAHPFGVGLDELNVMPFIPEFKLYVELAHNIYLDLATRVGLEGLLAFLVLAGVVTTRNLRAIRLTRDPDRRRIAACLFFLVSGFLLGGFFEPIYQNSSKLVNMFWLYCGVSLAMSGRLLAEGRAPARLSPVFASGAEAGSAEGALARATDKA